MTFSPILDVLIGMAGVYVAFSLLASWCQERAAAALDLRSKGLVTGIYQILNGNKTAFTQFTQDPIFIALQQAGQNTVQTAQAAAPAVANPAALAKNGPSYMSREQFSAIFMNMLAAKGAQVTAAASATAAAASAATTVNPATGTTPAMAAAAAAANAVQSIQAAGTALGMGPQVGAVLAKSGADINAFVSGIETLYDDHMDRVSGWYKRESHKILIVIGAVLAIFFNLDSIRLYEGLNCNSALRGAVSTAATRNSDPSSNTIVQGMIQALPLGWSGFPDDPIKCYLGSGAAAATPPSVTAPYLFLKVLGLLITVIALSLGAPFWFDTLSCLTNVRAAGKKPDSDAKATT